MTRFARSHGPRPWRSRSTIRRRIPSPSWALGESTGSLPAAGLADELLEF